MVAAKNIQEELIESAQQQLTTERAWALGKPSSKMNKLWSPHKWFETRADRWVGPDVSLRFDLLACVVGQQLFPLIIA
jgi:hypothetical protein